MKCSPEYSFNPAPSNESGFPISDKAANVAYQSLTIAAMILLLGTLWVF